MNNITEKERSKDLHAVEESIGYKFNDINNLDRALRHSSYRNKDDNVSEYRSINECLEFLGDSILDFAIGEYLFNNHPDWDEGRLSKFRARVVCEQSLVLVAARMELWRYILVGRGEQDGKNMNPSIMADAVEAVIAGIYIDGGMDAAKACIMRLLLQNINDINNKKILRDSKTELQELIQQYHKEPIKYTLISRTGPQHDPIFTVSAVFDSITVGMGKGKSKKEAEQHAAAEAYEPIKKLLQGRKVQ